jgi:hypothetical protein
MSPPPRPSAEEVEHLLRNAQLRDELEPFLDESISRVNVKELPTPAENEFLESMLAWERAPVVPVGMWFAPPLVLPPAESLSDEMLHAALWDAIHKLYAMRIVLDFTDHLSDRELYRVIRNDLLTSREKKVDTPSNFLHWDCADITGDPDVWLRYYASEEERRRWSEEFACQLPPSEIPPFRRKLPCRPL